MFAWRRRLRALKSHFEVADGSAGRSLPMEGLRGVAVALVFMVHYASLIDPFIGGVTRDLAGQLHRLGNTGVDLFFILSGYLIYGALIRRARPYGNFIVRRVERLYPTFLVVLALYIALSVLFPEKSKIPDGRLLEAALYLLANLLMLPGIFDIVPIITVAWSLSYEMFFYLVVPWLVAGLGMRRWPVAARIAACALAALVIVVTDAPHPRMALFLCGMALADALPRLSGQNAFQRWIDALGLFAAVSCGAWLLLGTRGRLDIVVLFVSGFVFCAAALGGRGMIARTLSVAPLRWLGNMSYSFYLLHGLALHGFFLVLAKLVPPAANGGAMFWIMLAPAFGAATVASAVLYLAVERPLSILPGSRGTSPVPSR